MFMQRLYELRERLDDADMPPDYHKITRTPWAIALDGQGAFLGWVQQDDLTGYVPDNGRTSGVCAYPLADKFEYNFGVKLADLDAALAQGAPLDEAVAKAGARSKKCLEAHQQAVALVLEQAALDDTGRATVEACAHFLASDAQRLRALEARPASLTEGDLLTFVVDGVSPHALSAAQQHWAQHQEDDESGKVKLLESECMLCGQRRVIATKHPKLSFQGNQGSLVSANEAAFESYGLERSQIAPTCSSCAQRYMDAARYLMRERQHHLRAGDVTYLFWTREPQTFSVASFLDDPDPAQVEQLLRSPHRPVELGVADPDAFYAAALTINTSRLVVRDMVETTLAAAQSSLAAWFDGMALIDHLGQRSKPHGVFALAASTVLKSEQLAPRVLPSLVRAALYGDPLPPDLLVRALQRIAADHKDRWTRPRMALVRLVVNDLLSPGLRRQVYLYDPTHKEKIMGESLNPEHPSAAYQCGRLFATLEAAQREALPGLNTTIADRFFGTASSAPATVFGRLLRGAQAHMQKLERDRPCAHHAIQERLEQICAQIGAFPRTLGLTEQGLFALGYYHQRGEDSRRKQEAIEAKKAAAQSDKNEQDNA
jgi:CRISPR-associated protein Csd1